MRILRWHWQADRLCAAGSVDAAIAEQVRYDAGGGGGADGSLGGIRDCSRERKQELERRTDQAISKGGKMNEMEFDPEKVEGWEFAANPECDWMGIFWKAKSERNGFEFVVLECTSTDSRFSGSPFVPGSGAIIEIFAHGSAMFDGVRHLYFGSEKTDNYGYVYYPDFRNMKWAMLQLEILEGRYCGFRSHEYERPKG